MTRRALRLLALAALLACTRTAQTPPLVLVTTTSTHDSGVMARLVPEAEKAVGRRIRSVSVGSGEALALGARGDGDVVIAHAPDAEIARVEKGELVDRRPLMWNRFLVVGPPSDPARVREAGGDPVEAFRRIHAAGATFVSRGDESGTHRKEGELWRAAKVKPKVRETGQGQGETLLVADELDAYALVDSATFSKVRVRRLTVLLDPADRVAGEVSLVNPYHVLRSPRSDESAKRLVDWLTGPAAAAVLGSGGLFTPGAPEGGG